MGAQPHACGIHFGCMATTATGYDTAHSVLPFHGHRRQKVTGEKTSCPCGDASGIWCGNCLDIRMGENLDEVRLWACWVVRSRVCSTCSSSACMSHSNRQLSTGVKRWLPKRTPQPPWFTTAAMRFVLPGPSVAACQVLPLCAAGQWLCPVCRGVCNCSGAGCLRLSRGWQKTGQLHHEVKDMRYRYPAYKSVSSLPGHTMQGQHGPCRATAAAAAAAAAAAVQALAI